MSKLNQAKFNATFSPKFPLYKCRTCGSEVQAKHVGEFVACDCFQESEQTTGFFYDPLYFNDKGHLIMRQGGNTDDMEEIPE